MATIPVEECRRIENWHYRFQLSMYFSGRHQVQGAVLYYSETIEDPYWNFATQVDSDEAGLRRLLETVAGLCEARGRRPAFYVTPWARPSNLREWLAEAKYSMEFADAWVVYRGQSLVTGPASLEGLAIEPVLTAEDRAEFIRVFNEAYGGESEGAPYSGLPPSYGDALGMSMSRPGGDSTAVHYLARLLGEPVGVGSLVYGGGYAGLYNMGVLPSRRGGGIGRSLALLRVNEALRRGNHTLFLQTEAGELVERMYHRIGFETAFVGEGWVRT